MAGRPRGAGATFVILDDEDYAQLDGRLVQTDFAAGGLFDVHVDRAIRMPGGWASVAEAKPVRPDGVSEEVSPLVAEINASSDFVAPLLALDASNPLPIPDSLADVLAAKQCGDCAKGVVEAYGYHAKGLGSVRRVRGRLRMVARCPRPRDDGARAPDARRA